MNHGHHQGWYGPPPGYYHPQMQLHYQQQHYYHHLDFEPEDDKCCGLPYKKKGFWCFLCALAAIGIGVGVGVGVSRHKHSSGTTAVAPSYAYAPTVPTTIVPGGTPQATASAGTSLKSYALYSGDGSTAQGWPGSNDWIDFNTMWSVNSATIASGCATWSMPDNDSAEISELKSAIQSIASASGVDPRFVLATVMQESKGCVRAPTTNWGVNNLGLMQSHDGAGTCNQGGSVQNPCPSSEITQIIQDGTGGTASGDGLEGCLQKAGGSGAQQVYRAARIYNSGSLPGDGDLSSGGSTSSYPSDIANRLCGWAN